MPVSTDPDRSSATNTNGMWPRSARPPAHRESGSLRAELHLRRRPLSRVRARLAAQSGVPDQHGDLHHPLSARFRYLREADRFARTARTWLSPCRRPGLDSHATDPSACRTVPCQASGPAVSALAASPSMLLRISAQHLLAMQFEPQSPALQVVRAMIDRNQEPQTATTECA